MHFLACSFVLVFPCDAIAKHGVCCGNSVEFRVLHLLDVLTQLNTPNTVILSPLSSTLC